MPIYIDSHDLRGQNVTPAEVAQAHEADLETQEAYDVRFLTYWFDPERGEVSCLVDAPNAEALTQVHKEAHGGVPTRVFEVDMEEVRSFLGRVSDPQPPEDDPLPPYSFIDSAFRVIMFTDMQDSTAMATVLGDQEAFEILEVHDVIIKDAVQEHDGRIVKHTGDGFMAAFPRVDLAVKSAMAAQRKLGAHNDTHPDRPIHVRIGINAGVPVDRSGDLFGVTVQLAARICAQADPEQILAAGIIHELCEDPGLLAAYHEFGRAPAKGFAYAVSLFEIDWKES